MDPKQRQFSIWYMFIALWVLILLQTFLPSFFNPTEIPYSEFKASVAAGKVIEVAVAALSVEQLHWLLEGNNLSSMQPQPTRNYQRVG